MNMRWIVCAVVLAGCGSESEKPEPKPVPKPPVVEVPPPPVDRSLGAGYEMSGLVKDGRITLVPIIATADASAGSYVPLQVAMARGKASVREMPGMIVDTLRVHNREAQPLFIVSGELVIEGMQDRVFLESTVLAPGEKAEVKVRCVERDRQDGDASFVHAGAIADLSIRRVIADQNQVWTAVDAINARARVEASTDTYRHAAALHRKAPITTRRDRLQGELAKHPDRQRMVGIAIALDGKVIAIDRFASPALYQALEAQLLASYVASDFETPAPEGARLTPEAVRALAALAPQTSSASFTAVRPINDRALDPNGDPWE